MKKVICLFLFGILLVITNIQLKTYKKKNDSSFMLASELPASMQVTGVALGPMKGLLVDILWWRAERLQEKRQFFEALQLSEWMTALQPTYPSIWSYQGYNLAFNIAYIFSDVDERWKWIMAGFKLLRDKGLKYIPDWENNRRIRFEMVFILSQKMSGYSDPEVRRMQNYWTQEMLNYFQNGDREEIERLASAPANEEELMAVEEVSELFAKTGVPKAEFLEGVRKVPPPESAYLPDKPKNRSHNKALDILKNYYQRKLIEKDLKLDFDKIIKTDDKYGPLDWRSHEAQIIYWGMEDDPKKHKLGGVNYDAYMRNAFVSSFFNGRVVMSEKKDYFYRTYNLQILPKLHDYFDFVLFEGLPKGTAAWNKVDLLHRDFIQKAITITYTYNQKEASRELFEVYKSYRKGITFENFLLESFARNIRGVDKNAKKSFIESIIFEAYQEVFRGEWDRYYGLIEKAKLIWTIHQKENIDVKSRQLPPFKDILKTAKDNFKAITEKSEEQIKMQSDHAEKGKTKEKLSIGGRH